MPPEGRKAFRGADRGSGDLGENGRAGSADDELADYTKEWTKSERDHWAFKPVKKSPVPEVKNKEWGTDAGGRFYRWPSWRRTG